MSSPAFIRAATPLSGGTGATKAAEEEKDKRVRLGKAREAREIYSDPNFMTLGYRSILRPHRVISLIERLMSFRF
jgi:hypothetical protein